MMRVIVVDDEPPARRKLRHLLASEADVAIVGEAGSGAEAVDLLGQTKADLVFLDIQLPDCSGFDVIEALEAGRRPPVVFVTAHHEFALRAFDVHAVDYLLKPVEPSRFAQSLQRVRDRIQSPEARQFGGLPETLRGAAGFEPRLLIREKGRSLFLDPERIDWVEAARNYVCIYCGSATHVVRESLDMLEGKLNAELFRRVSRAEIVNVRRIAEVRSIDHGDRQVTLTTGKTLRWTRRYWREGL